MMNVDRYTAEYLRQYDEGSFELHLIAARRRRVLASLQKYHHDDVLEVGCGAEPLCRHAPDYRRYTIVEPSPQFAEHAGKYAAGMDGVVIVQARLEEYAERFGSPPSFDFIILSSVLHEVEDPSRLLRAVHSLSRPETTVHINVPNVYSLHRLVALEMGLISSLFEPSAEEIRFQRHTRFDRASLLAFVRDHGFRVLHFETYMLKPLSNEQMSMLLRKGIVGDKLVEALDRLTKYLPDMGCEMLVEVAAR